MAVRPVVPGVVQVLWKGHFTGGLQWLNKLFVSYAGGAPTAVDLNTYSDNVLTAFQGNITPLQHTDVSIDEVETTDLASSMGAVGVSVGVTPGTRAGVQVAGNAAVLVNYHVSRHYRGGHPRSYIVAGVAADLTSASEWAGGLVADVHTAMLAMVTAMLTSAGAFIPSQHVNVSYFGGAPTDPITHKSIPRVAALVDVIAPAGLTVATEVASQRRRIGRR
jgi:hypothetical protein